MTTPVPTAARCSKCRQPMQTVTIRHPNGRVLDHNLCRDCLTTRAADPEPRDRQPLRIVR